MTVQEVLTALGQWEIDLLPTIPREDMDRLAYFGHVAIVHGRIDPRAYGDTLLPVARYVGVLRSNSLADDARTKIPNDNVKIGGPGLAMWLGDEDDKGAVLETPVTLTSSTFPNAVRALLPASGAVTEGTLHPVAGTYSGTHQWTSPRKAIQYVCDTMSTPSVPVSWRVNNDGTLDAGPESDLFVTNPTCVVVARGAGEDMTMRAVPGSMDLSGDAEDYTTRVVLLAEGEGTATATGSADITPGTNPYKDLHGHPLQMTRMVSESGTVTANATVRAQLALSQFLTPKRDLRLSIQDYDVEGTFKVGDWVWAYDPDKGLVDTANEIVFRGQRLNPIRLQVTELSWGVTEEYTVAYRTADGTWIDLTDHIQTSDAGTYVTVGGFSRQLTGSSAEPVGSRPRADTSIPGVPVLVEPFRGAAYLDSRGFTRARVILSWNAPLNVDGSTVLDGDHYEIRYAVDTDMIYPASWSRVSQVRWMDLQSWAQPFAAPSGAWQTVYAAWGESSLQLQDLSTGVGYDVQIRAVDRSGNAGQWSGTTTFVTTEDNIPPSTPASPSVAGSRIALQITHQLGRATGGTFNLESDLHHLEVHVEYEPTFTPSSSTLRGKVAATAGMIQARIPVVFTVQVEETSPRWVRVVAVDVAGNASGPSQAVQATALLIDDAHISDLTVSKVTAGTIGADWIVGARIKTADAGARVELNSGGIGCWDSGGTQTVAIAASTGSVWIRGQLVSELTGRRVEINPTSTFLPEIRFYANSGSAYSYINGVSSDATVNLGINGSSYVSDGTAVHSRVYLMTNVASEFAIVRDDTEAREGGYVSVQHNSYFSGFSSGGAAGGMYYADSAGVIIGGRGDKGGIFTASTTSARVGTNLGDVEDTYANFDHTDGSIRVVGELDYYSNPQNAVMMGGNAIGGFNGLVFTYGITMTGSPRVLPALYDPTRGNNNAIAVNISQRSTTGFTASFAGVAGSGSEVAWWAYRTN